MEQVEFIKKTFPNVYVRRHVSGRWSVQTSTRTPYKIIGSGDTYEEAVTTAYNRVKEINKGLAQ